MQTLETSRFFVDGFIEVLRILDVKIKPGVVIDFEKNEDFFVASNAGRINFKLNGEYVHGRIIIVNN